MIEPDRVRAVVQLSATVDADPVVRVMRPIHASEDVLVLECTETIAPGTLADVSLYDGVGLVRGVHGLVTESRPSGEFVRVTVEVEH